MAFSLLHYKVLDEAFNPQLDVETETLLC